MKVSFGGIIREPGNFVESKNSGIRKEKPVIEGSGSVHCEKCSQYCPDSAIFKDSKGNYKIDYDYCKGCGICSQTCAARCITMVKEE